MKANLFIHAFVLTIFAICCNVPFTFAQDKVYTKADVMPSFPGGKDALAKFLKVNTKYPLAADTAKVTGSVTISFIVEKSGALTNLDITQSLRGGCDAEALRVVRKMPKWNPGTISSKAVRVAYKIAIKFPQ